MASWQYHPLLLVFQLGGVVSIGVAVYCLRRVWTYGHSNLVVSVGLLAFHNAIFNVAATLKVASPTLDTKLLMYKLEFLGSAVNPSVAIALALAYLGYSQWLSRGMIAVLILIPAVAISGIVLNPNDVMIEAPTLVSINGISTLEHEFPPLFVAYLAWAHGALLFAGLLVGHAAATPKVRHAPGLLLGLALILPVSASAFKVLGIYPPGGEGINVTPAFSAASLIMVALAIGRYRLFELLPIGREQAFEVMHDGYILTDASGKIVDANSSARKLLKDSSEATLVSQPVSDVLPVSEDLNDTKSSVPFTKGDRMVQVRSSPLMDSNHVAGRVLILRDVTALREREQELERENERLDRFAGLLSHDLRNPLNVAKGRLSLAKEEDDPSHLRAVDRALTRMDEIVEEVLTLTWSGQTITAEDRQACSLSEVATASWDQVDTAEATLRVEEAPVVKAEKGRLRRLLENLFRNAVEHGGTGVTVRIGALKDGFFVEDDGPGISEQKHGKVLEEGYSSREEGTGLGLSIVQAIAEAHEWDLSITEGRDGGARFEVRGVKKREEERTKTTA